MFTSDLSQAPVKPSTLKLPVLRQGSSGSAVRVLQQLLNFKGFNLTVDGEFGLLTEEAVRDFQQIQDLAVDGVVDAKTWYNLSFGLLPIPE